MGVGGFHNNLGATFIRRGEIDAARQHLRISQKYFEQAQARDWLPELYYHWAEAALLCGELSEAEAQGRQATSLARELEMRREEGMSLRVLGQFEQAQGHLYASLALLEQVGDEYEEARSQLALARLHASKGEQPASLAALERCMPIFERLGAALDLVAAQALREEIVREDG